MGLANILDEHSMLQRQCAEEGLTLMRQERNHQRLTPIGTLKVHLALPETCVPASPRPRPPGPAAGHSGRFSRLSPGARGGQSRDPRTLRPQPDPDREIRLPQLAEFSRNPHEFRSADIARLLDRQPELLADLAREISRMVIECGEPGCRHRAARLPVAGLVGPCLAELEKRTGCTIREVATMPPSLIGMRGCRRPLKRRFMALGGTFLTSERVLGARYQGTGCSGCTARTATISCSRRITSCFASGSFFSRGLESRLGASVSPSSTPMCLSLSGARRLGRSPPVRSPPFMGFGVKTDDQLRVLRAASHSPTSTVPAACWRTMTPSRKGQVQAWRLATGWQAAGHILAEGWR